MQGTSSIVRPQFQSISPQYPSMLPQLPSLLPHFPSISPQHPPVSLQHISILPQHPTMPPQHTCVFPQHPATPLQPSLHLPPARDERNILPPIPAFSKLLKNTNESPQFLYSSSTEDEDTQKSLQDSEIYLEDKHNPSPQETHANAMLPHLQKLGAISLGEITDEDCTTKPSEKQLIVSAQGKKSLLD